MRTRASILWQTLLLTIVVVGQAPDTVSQTRQFVSIVRDAKNRVCRVEDASGALLGTAFKINKYGNLLTCAHVVGDRDTVFLSSYGTIVVGGDSGATEENRQARFAARVDARFPQLDIAVLKVSLESYGYKSFSFFTFEDPRNLSEGEDVAICAFVPDDFTVPKPFISRGIISTIRSDVYDASLGRSIGIAQLDLRISKGTSGGPIFSSQTGAVIAIQRQGMFGSKDATQTSYAVGLLVGQVLNALDSIRIPYALRR